MNTRDRIDGALNEARNVFAAIDEESERRGFVTELSVAASLLAIAEALGALATGQAGFLYVRDADRE